MKARSVFNFAMMSLLVVANAVIILWPDDMTLNNTDDHAGVPTGPQLHPDQLSIPSVTDLNYFFKHH